MYQNGCDYDHDTMSSYYTQSQTWQMYQLVASITELKTEDQFLYTSKLDTKGALHRLNQMVS